MLALGGLEVALRLAGYGYSPSFFQKFRVGNEELLVNNDKLKDMVVQRVNAGVIRNEALKNGAMRTLRQDGWRKVQLGQTTIEEVARTTAGDIIAVV